MRIFVSLRSFLFHGPVRGQVFRAVSVLPPGSPFNLLSLETQKLCVMTQNPGAEAVSQHQPDPGHLPDPRLACIWAGETI
jgi:hypothetical protein